MTQQYHSAAHKLTAISDELADIFLELDDEIHGLALALLADTNVLLLGPPGVGKTKLVETFSRRIVGGKHFAWMLNNYSAPEELAGSHSLQHIMQDKYVRITDGKLPEAHTAFIDEIFKGNSGVINFLLTILNERAFYNDGVRTKVPLLGLFGASNELPEESDGLGAALDRFAIKYDVKPVKENDSFKRMLLTPVRERAIEQERTPTTIDILELLEARDLVRNVIVPEPILNLFVEIRQNLNKLNVEPSSRVWVKCIQILQAEAFLHGSDTVLQEHLHQLKNCLWSKPSEIPHVESVIFKYVTPHFYECKQIYNGILSVFQNVVTTYKDGKLAGSQKTGITAEAAEKVKKGNQRLTQIRQQMHKANDTKDIETVEEMSENAVKIIQALLAHVASDAPLVDPTTPLGTRKKAAAAAARAAGKSQQ